jgi:hypothetical protein
MWVIGRDKRNLFDVVDILEGASLSREEPELDAAIFNDDGEGNNIIILFYLYNYIKKNYTDVF